MDVRCQLDTPRPTQYHSAMDDGTRIRVSPGAHHGLRVIAAELTKRSGGRQNFSLIDACDFAVITTLSNLQVGGKPSLETADGDR